MVDIAKYPRTEHVEGSRLQPGDEDLQQVPLSSLVGKHLVLEEKMDGGNSGISAPKEKTMLQSRGHYLTGGPREAQFTLLKQWTATHGDLFAIALGDRHVAYGEWLFKKHTVFYDLLPHFWMEFDILDRMRSDFQAFRDSGFVDSSKLFFYDTPTRARMLSGLPYVPVKVLWDGQWKTGMRFEDFIGPSHFKSGGWRDIFRRHVEKLGFNWELVWDHTDQSDLMEGLYVKWEENGRVRGRYKFVRHDFVSLISSNDEHHDNLPFVPNLLAPGVDLFAT